VVLIDIVVKHGGACPDRIGVKGKSAILASNYKDLLRSLRLH